MRSPAILLFGLLGAAAACDGAPTRTETTATPPSVALVIDDRPISEAEIALRMRARGPGKPTYPREEAVETVITQELQARAAERLGLDREPAFLSEMALVEAKVRDARRQALAKLYRMRALTELPPIPESEVRAFIEAQGARIRTELRLERITTRTPADAESALAAVREGRPFGEVAGSFPGESVELGPLGFDTTPDAWWEALSGLEPGQFTGVLPVGDDRFVILKLVERKEVPEPEPEALRRRVEAVLQVRAFEARRREADAELRRAARIERRDPPAPAPRLED